MTAAHPDSSRQ